jgi:hypothetical protein
MLSNPAKAKTANLEGIVYVISRMDWYCLLTDHLRDSENEDKIAVRKQLEQKVVELYKAILLYQMKSVCSYYRNQYKEFVRNLVDLKAWDGARTSVETAEETLKEDWEQYRNLQATGLWGNLVKLTEKNQSLLMDISQTLEKVISLQKGIRMDDEYQNCLRDLRVVNPQDDMMRIVAAKEELLEDTNEWIFKEEKYAAFTDWGELQKPPCQLLWVKGSAGTGKTMLLSGIIRQLSSRPAVFQPALSYFFCQTQGKTDLLLNNATATLRSLVWMLLIQQPDLFSKYLQADYKSSGSALFTDQNAPATVYRIFKDMLKDARPVYFIIDALDECDQGLETLIKLISTSLAGHDKVRWLVSSRPEVDILAKLKNPPYSIDRAILETLAELDIQSQKDRVDKYIKHKLSDLVNLPKIGSSYTEEIQASILHEVRKQARENFLWMSLVFKDLKTIRGHFAVDKIKDYPASLPELYKYKMTRIEKVEPEYVQYCKDTLVATSLAYRPLSLSELAVLVSLPEKTDPYSIVCRCESFLTIENEIVSLNHKSVKDYMMDYQSKLLDGVAQGHANIGKRSIQAMSKVLKRNIYSLPNVGCESKGITVPSPDPLEGIRYCCVYWAHHLRESRRKIGDDDQVNDFLQIHLLHWLEALSCMGKISDGILAILSLEEIVLVSFPI